MSKRIAIMALEAGQEPHRLQLPAGVRVVDTYRDFFANRTYVRLEGSGLPHWCTPPAYGEKYQTVFLVHGKDTFFGEVAA